MRGRILFLRDGKGRVMSGLPELPAGREPQRVTRCCRYCRHWHAPVATLLAAYDAFREGVTKRPVKQPTGHCDQVLVAEGRPVSFSTTAPGFTCLNFATADTAPRSSGGGIVTVYEDEQVIWSSSAEDLPDEYS